MTDKEIPHDAIEQIYAAALAQLERWPDHVERLAAAYEANGAKGVQIEMLRIVNEQALGIRSLINDMLINRRLTNGATESGSSGFAGRGSPMPGRIRS